MTEKLVILFISSLIALAAGFLPGISFVETAYQNLAWFFMLAIAVIVVIAISKSISGQNLRAWVADNSFVILISLAIVICATLLSPPEFRVLADETNLLGVSLEMHENLKTRLPLETLYFYHGMRNGISYKTEMRPPGYPFALSILHSLTGYRPENAFALNFALAWLTLLLAFTLVKRHTDRSCGIAGMILLAAFPVFVQCAGSAGFEMYNLALCLAAFNLMDLCLAGPAKTGTAIAVLLLLAFSRYESIVGIFCFLPLLLVLPETEAVCGSLGRRFKWVFPLLLVPAVWLRRLTWDIKSFQVENLEEAFALENVWANLIGYWQYFVTSGLNRFVGPLLLAVAMVGFVFWVKSFFAPAKNRNQKFFEIGLAAFFALHFAARLFYAQGNPMNAYTGRLALILLPVMVFLAVYALYRIQQSFSCMRSDSVIKLLPPIAAFLLLATSWPAASGCNGANSLALFREFRWVRQQLNRLAAGEETVLVCERPNLYVPMKYSAVGGDYARANADKIRQMLQISSYRRLIFIETINYKTGQSNMPDIAGLFAGLRAEVVFETQLTGVEKLKITSLSSE